MNEETTGKILRQVEHINGHLWHRYSIAVNQVMVATVKLSMLVSVFASSVVDNDVMVSVFEWGR